MSESSSLHIGVEGGRLPQYSRQDLCRLLLGQNFVSTGEVSEKCHFSYTDDQIRSLARNVPAPEHILELHDRGYVLVPGPPETLNLESLSYKLWRMTMPEKFGLPEEPVSSDTVEAAAWLAIKKDMRPKSVWSFKDRSLAKVETYANAAEVVYAAFVLARSRGVNLLPDFHVRTTSLTRSGRCVRVGPYKNGDFHLSQSGSFFRYDDISPDSPGLFLAGFLLFCTHISNHIK